MATAVTVEAHRKRFNVKVGAMQPLSAVVADVLGQLNLRDVRPEDCRLTLKGKLLDLGTPLRFANIGRTDKLELTTGREPVLGVHTAPAPAAPAPAAAPAVAAPTAAAAPASAPQQPTPTSLAAPASRPAAPPQQPAAAPAPHQQQQQQQQQQLAAAPVPVPAAPAAASAPALAAGPSSTAPGGAAQDSHPSVALFGRRVHVFTRQAEKEADAGASAGGGNEDDSFFEFTETDLRRAMASQASQRAKQEGGHLMTAAMRQREEQRRAEAYGAVPIRLYLPDGVHCLQTVLPATEPLSSVLALARAALLPGVAAGAHLFTTPPRTVLKDLSLSLYAAKLIPAAKVHVGLDASKASPAAGTAAELIRPDVLALVEAPPQRADVMHARKAPAVQQEQAAAGGGSAGASGSGAAGAAARPGATGGKGVPKWLKLGK